MLFMRTSLLLLCLLAGSLCAQEMQTRAYHIPPDIPARPFSDRETYDPFTHLIPDYNDDSLSVLEAAGVTFPPGASCQFDRITELLTIHNTRENLALVDKYVGELVKLHPRTLRWHLSIVEAPAGKISAGADAAAQLSALRKASAQPGSGLRWLAEAMVEGKGGTRVTHEAITEHAVLTPPRADKRAAIWSVWTRSTTAPGSKSRALFPRMVKSSKLTSPFMRLCPRHWSKS